MLRSLIIQIDSLGILKRELALEQQRREKIISDHLGSPIEVRTTTGGLPVLSCKYDSFGNIIEQNGDFELPFRFAGGIWDEDTKLIRFGVRDYDPEVGRWTSVEPLGFAGSRNWYVYAENDGVNYLDLDGRAYKCRRPLSFSDGTIMGQFYHEYICTDKGYCGGFTTRGNPLLGRGDATTKEEDNPDIEGTSCIYLEEDDECMDHCLTQKIDKTRPLIYSILFSNCQHWAQYVYNSCIKQCKGGKKSYSDTMKYLFGEKKY